MSVRRFVLSRRGSSGGVSDSHAQLYGPRARAQLTAAGRNARIQLVADRLAQLLIAGPHIDRHRDDRVRAIAAVRRPIRRLRLGAGAHAGAELGPQPRGSGEVGAYERRGLWELSWASSMRRADLAIAIERVERRDGLGQALSRSAGAAAAGVPRSPSSAVARVRRRSARRAPFDAAAVEASACVTTTLNLRRVAEPGDGSP